MHGSTGLAGAVYSQDTFNPSLAIDGLLESQRGWAYHGRLRLASIIFAFECANDIQRSGSFRLCYIFADGILRFSWTSPVSCRLHEILSFQCCIVKDRNSWTSHEHPNLGTLESTGHASAITMCIDQAMQCIHVMRLRWWTRLNCEMCTLQLSLTHMCAEQCASYQWGRVQRSQDHKI